MTCFAVFRVKLAHATSDVESPVSALCYVFVVAEGKHEFVAGLGVLGASESALRGALGEAVVGEGWGYDVEGRAAGLGEEGKDGEDFDKGAGPWSSVSMDLERDEEEVNTQPWQNNSGIAFLTSLFCHIKWMSSSPKPSTLMPVWNWGTLLSLSSACRQSHCCQDLTNLLISDSGTPTSHADSESSSGNSASESLVFRLSIFSWGMEIVNGCGAIVSFGYVFKLMRK